MCGDFRTKGIARTYIDSHSGQREYLRGRHVARHIAIELVAILVPLDGVE